MHSSWRSRRPARTRDGVMSPRPPGSEPWEELLLRDALGERAVGGAVLHLGDTVAALSERVWSLPVDSLWQRYS